MELQLFFLFILNLSLFIVSASDVFHVKSKVTFRPDQVANYFGYSVLLSDMG